MAPVESVGNEGVQRRVGALVDLLGDRSAVDEVGDGLADSQCLGVVGFGRGGAVGLRVEVEHDVADLATGAVDDLNGVVGREVGDVGRREAAVRHVDVALLHGELEVRRLGEVAQDDAAVDRCLEQTLVVLVGRELDGLVEVVRRDLVRSAESVRVHDVLVGGERVCGEHLVIDDRAGEARQDVAGRSGRSPP